MTGSPSDRTEMNRRQVLQAGALAGASAITLAPVVRADDPPASKATLPTRKLGKTGVDVTILNQGTWQASGLDRILRLGYSGGIRYYDTAKAYGSEPSIKRWLQQMPEVRKNIFLVTKDTPHDPSQMVDLIDQRLDALGTDYIDLFFIHAMGDAHYPKGSGLEWPKSKAFRDAAEKIRKSGKAKFVGFSTHHPTRAQILQAAVEGGFVDAIMLQYSPWVAKDSALNKALDAAHKAGIGLISMKQVANEFGNAEKGDNLDELKKKYPEVLKERKLSPYQGLLTAIWTDERISSSCVSMRNTDQVRWNIEAAQKFKPLSTAELEQIKDAFLASGPTLCTDCEGQCSLAAGTKARLGDITRYLTYHDRHGDKTEAKRLFAELPDHERDWKGADLEAARAACPHGLDFARLLPRAEERLA